MNGVWIRGATQSLNTFATFYHVQGSALGDTDLRDNLGAGNTGYVDDGAGASGDHSAAIMYNNVVGNSYQVSVKAGATGTEQLGSVLFIAPNQCDISEPNVLGFMHDPDDLDLWISQAQCRGDPVEFEINRDPPGVGTLANLNVTIIDGFTNLAVLLVDDSQMFIVAPPTSPRLLHFNRTLAPGPYVAVALEDNTVSTDHFSGRAFNVPIGTCLDPVQQPPNISGTCTSNCSAPFLLNTTLGSGFSLDALLVIIVIYLIIWFIWARSLDWALKFLTIALMGILFFATFFFINKWQYAPWLTAMVGLTFAYMPIRTAYDLVVGFKERAASRKRARDEEEGSMNV